jgi:hypothetical protein
MSDTDWKELAIELLNALEADHRAIDMLLADRLQLGEKLARFDHGVAMRDYYPTKSVAWLTIENSAAAMRKARALLK